MKTKLISFTIILFSCIACCTLAPLETGNFELKKTDADLIPYKSGEKVHFVDSKGTEFDFIVSEDITKWEKQPMRMDMFECPYKYFSFQARYVSLVSLQPNLKFRFNVQTDSTIFSFLSNLDTIPKEQSNAVHGINITFNDVYYFGINYDKQLNIICGDTLTACFDSIRINGNLYTSVFEKEITTRPDNSRIEPKSMLFNKAGLLQIKMTNNETYSIKQ